MTKHLTLSLMALAIFSSCSNDGKVPLAATTHANQGNAAGIYNAARAAEAAGQTGKAIKLYEDVAEKYPLAVTAPDARYRHAVLLDRKGDLVDAFDSYQIYLTKYPASPNYGQALKRQEAVAHAAAQGKIRRSFIGISSRLDSKKVAGMLEKVRQNAPRAASAPKAQFAVGQVWENAGKEEKAIPAYRLVTIEYGDSSYAPEAQYRIGAILLAQAEKGNQDQANIDRAKQAFQDVINRYPGSKRAGQARAQIAKLGSADIQRSFDVAEFYRKKGQTSSAIFYYREVVRRSKSGTLHNRALRRLQELGASR